jgi:hypothetical protein
MQTGPLRPRNRRKTRPDRQRGFQTYLNVIGGIMNLCECPSTYSRRGDFSGSGTDQRRRAIIFRLSGVVLFSAC